MGLLDRVKQNQTGAPPVSGPVSNGPAVATAPGGATSYSTSSAVPKARPTDTAAADAGSLNRRISGVGELMSLRLPDDSRYQLVLRSAAAS